MFVCLCQRVRILHLKKTTTKKKSRKIKNQTQQWQNSIWMMKTQPKMLTLLLKVDCLAMALSRSIFVCVNLGHQLIYTLLYDFKIYTLFTIIMQPIEQLPENMSTCCRCRLFCVSWMIWHRHRTAISVWSIIFLTITTKISSQCTLYLN